MVPFFLRENEVYDLFHRRPNKTQNKDQLAVHRKMKSE